MPTAIIGAKNTLNRFINSPSPKKTQGHNTTDIKPEWHSTDTHGTNQVNFWILRVFGYQFGPRYRDLHKKSDGLTMDI
jgi:Tn3 transposase DDE domain